uniref:Uncharacterized protein n=1 Tax=Mimivirus LCMiAC02 TaxID=2506609 RepID=A0A4D5XEY6_9VIRU|nr:MAG: uncharacterized protein LCMiAC02_04020 [Mimivirus LCMiAC02]
MSKLFNKISYAAIGAGLFAMLSRPETFNFLSNIVGSSLKTFVKEMGTCPSLVNNIYRAFFFMVIFLVIIIVLNMFALHNKKSLWFYFKHAIFAALFYFLISYSGVYKLVGKFTGLHETLISNGCPTQTAVLLHTLIYFFILFSSTFVPKYAY